MACCTPWPSPTSSASPSTSTSSGRSPTGPRSSPTCARAGATPRPTCTTPAASAWSCASCSSGRACSTATSPRSTAGPSPRSPPTRSRPRARRSCCPIETPLKPTGGLAILHGTLAPDGCVVKLAGHERREHRGPARVFDSEHACYEAVKERRINPGDVVVIRWEGPVGGPGHAGDAAGHRGARRRGPGRLGRAHHRRPVQRRDPRPDRSATSPPRPPSAARSPSSRRATRSSSMSTARRSTSTCRPDEIARRLARLDAARPELPRRRAGQVRGPRRLGVAGCGHDRPADDGEPAWPLSASHAGGPAPPGHQDLATGRRLGDAGRRLGAHRRARRVRLGLDERPPDRHRPGRARAEPRGADRDGRARSTACPAAGSGMPCCPTTFRHPAVLAKAATVLDHATGGRFIVGLGAGWHEGEHRPFGIAMPAMPERFDRFESAVHVLRALWSEAARDAARGHPARPVLPADRGDQRAADPDTRRAAAVPRWPEAARHRAGRGGRPTAGCCRPSSAPGSRPTSTTSAAGATRILAAMEAIGRDSAGFAIVAQVGTGRTARGPGVGPRPGPRRARARRHRRSSWACRRISAPPAWTRSPARSPSRSARRSGDDRAGRPSGRATDATD